jgi:hypothetical protein
LINPIYEIGTVVRLRWAVGSASNQMPELLELNNGLPKTRKHLVDTSLYEYRMRLPRDRQEQILPDRLQDSKHRILDIDDATIEPTEGKLLYITRFRQLLLDIDEVLFSPELGARVIEIRCTLTADNPRRAFIVEPRFLDRVSLFLF